MSTTPRYDSAGRQVLNDTLQDRMLNRVQGAALVATPVAKFSKWCTGACRPLLETREVLLSVFGIPIVAWDRHVDGTRIKRPSMREPRIINMGRERTEPIERPAAGGDEISVAIRQAIKQRVDGAAERIRALRIAVDRYEQMVHEDARTSIAMDLGVPCEPMRAPSAARRLHEAVAALPEMAPVPRRAQTKD